MINDMSHMSVCTYMNTQTYETFKYAGGQWRIYVHFDMCENGVLRHSCASILLANGVSMKAIQEWLGHSTFNVTANFYSHLEYKSQIESAETIAKVLGGESSEAAEEDKTKKDGE